MRPTWSLLLLALTLTSTACEVHVGNADWDAGDIWNDDDDFWGGNDPWDSKKDAGKPATVKRDAGPGEDDAGQVVKDAAVSSNDAGKDAAVQIDAATIDAATEPGNEPMTLTVEMAAQVLARGSCGALEACMGEALLLDSLQGMDCVEYRSKVYADREYHWLAKSVALGRVTFRADLLTQCERDLMDRGCDVQSRRLPESCEDALEGKADVDEACAIDAECQGNGFCDKGMQETCPGTCAVLQRGGLPCNASSQCADGLVCRSGTCSAPLAVDDACTARLKYGECPPGLVCQGTSGALKCQTIATVYVGKQGATCDANGKLCESGLVCKSQSATSTQGICDKPAAAGGTCRPAVPSQCPADQYCKDARANVTTRAPAGKDGVCSALPDVGKTCESNIGCKPGLLCSTVDSTCHARRRVGESCSEARDCFGGSCVDGKCAAPIDCNR